MYTQIFVFSTINLPLPIKAHLFICIKNTEETTLYHFTFKIQIGKQKTKSGYQNTMKQ